MKILDFTVVFLILSISWVSIKPFYDYKTLDNTFEHESLSYRDHFNHNLVIVESSELETKKKKVLTNFSTYICLTLFLPLISNIKHSFDLKKYFFVISNYLLSYLQILYLSPPA